MKPRARRVTIGAAALVAVLLAVLAVANWSTVRDHVEAWHFQLARDTRTIEPLAEGASGTYNPEERLLHIAANRMSASVIFVPPPQHPFARRACDLPLQDLLPRTRWLPKQAIKPLLEKEGYRILKQRFPRRAYVVIRDADAHPDEWWLPRNSATFSGSSPLWPPEPSGNRAPVIGYRRRWRRATQARNRR